MFKLAVTVHRCLNGRAPLYLSHYCVPAAGADTRRQKRSRTVSYLPVNRYRFNTYGCRGFSVAGPTVWNSLPDFIRDPTISAGCFRHLLKTYLFDRYTCALSALEVLWRLLRYINLLIRASAYIFPHSAASGLSKFTFTFHINTSSSAIAERPRDARVTSIRKIAKWNFW